MIRTLKIIGLPLLLLCVIGKALSGDWGDAAVALAAAILLAQA